MKLTELQNFKIETALSYSQSVLSQIKQKPLKGKALKDMKLLESVVVNLEIFKLITA